MNNAMNMIASIFAGKGSTIRLAIFGSLIAAVAYEIMDSNYGLNVTMSEGKVSLYSVSGTGVQQMKVDPAKGKE